MIHKKPFCLSRNGFLYKLTCNHLVIIFYVNQEL